MVSWTECSQTGGDTSFTAIRTQIFDRREAAVRLNGTLAADSYFGTIFADQMAGGSDIVPSAVISLNLTGTGGANRVTGNFAVNILTGQSGNDTLVGLGGDDESNGSAETDTFAFAKGAGAGNGANRDRITEFAGGVDKIGLSAFVAGGAFIGAASFTPGNRPRVRFVAGTGILSGDADGNGSVDFQIQLDGAPVLTAADFLF